MAISRCNKCGNITEHERELVGTSSDCVQCGTATSVYDTHFFVSKLSDMYFALRKELNELRIPSKDSASGNLEKPSEVFDIHNSDMLSSAAQHAPVIEWFKTKNITATANVDAVDTTGFFDEAAVAIGSDYELLGEVCERIRYAQQKEFNSNLIYLDKKSKEDVKALEAFIQRLYDHSLIARCISNKKEKNIRIVLQNAPSVRRFFAGDWLEWYALMIGLRICQERKVEYSCARNMTLSFPSNEKRELDVFFLINKTLPLYIECKAGDFRQELDKYVALRKRLHIDQKCFILCVADLDSEQCKGLSAMYGMTFVNTQTLGQHLLTLF
ncbi:hypothetical protein [Methylotenera sp.]|uniref:hypothetical protein n=1 Tax=Methylotenera sp. TaxID=2051956 RepID=UPI0027301F2B|nr:hypothetical protein [Methylotenera sp.]MDP2230461.1 hypothetical protein [Methylotenera sp.]MDP3141172.1 hypothetical protein [Methylotenera sp.]